MTRNVNYKECTCDLCGSKEYISQSLILPKSWEQVRLRLKNYDLCEQCFIKVENAIEDLKAKENEHDGD